MKQRAALRWVLAVIVVAAGAMAAYWLSLRGIPRPADIAAIRDSVTPPLTQQLARDGFVLGDPVFIRIFKESKELDLWIAKGGRYERFKTYPICAYSGDLGPKLKEGDRQSPEGIYSVSASLLNPNSSYHLSFNLGFPNAYDTFHGRTGSFLMVHGRCVSIGCYAMTDPAIEEIYLLVEEALRQGQKHVPLHAFPFRMTADNMERHKQSQWRAFWTELKAVHDAFDATRIPPKVEARSGKYVILP